MKLFTSIFRQLDNRKEVSERLAGLCGGSSMVEQQVRDTRKRGVGIQKASCRFDPYPPQSDIAHGWANTQERNDDDLPHC